MLTKEKYLSELNLLESEIAQIVLESNKIKITLIHQRHNMFGNLYTHIVFSDDSYLVVDEREEKLLIPVGNFDKEFPLLLFNLEGCKVVSSCVSEGSFVINLEKAKLICPISTSSPESVSLYVDDGPDAFFF